MTDVQMQYANVQGAPPLPQANLLPPHVRGRRRLRAVLAVLALVVALVILAIALAAVATRLQRHAADQELADVQEQNATLQEEQKKYAEVPILLRAVSDREQARANAMATEVLWAPYVAAISAATPLDASVDSLSVSQDSLWSVTQVGTRTPLSTPGTVGQVSLNGRAANVDAVSAWEDNLNALTGVVDVEVTSIEVTDQDGNTYYAVGATFSLTPDAFANRYLMEQ